MEIKSAEFLISNSRADMCPTEKRKEYALIGRSNVGKSSLINMLTGKKSLAVTSSTPGKTILINHFIINKEWFLVDLPGYGFAKRSKKDVDKIQNIISHYVLDREQLTCLFVLIDSRLSPQKIDLDFIRFLGENEIPFSIVFTKADKPKVNELKRNINVFMNKLADEWEEMPQYFITSSGNGRGRQELLNYIEHLNSVVDC